jgi:hypothetical protein
MRRLRSLLVCLVLIALLLPNFSAQAQASIVATNDKATLEFPDRLTFSVHLKSATQIDRVVLEYGVVDQLTCGKVIAEAFPDLTPASEVDASWTWEMKQTGSQPPGSQIWWRWRVTDASGRETVTDQQTVTWLDDIHNWQTVSGGKLNLHWYSGGSSFGPELHDSAVQSLADLAKSTGLQLDSPADLYIYASTQDMQDAVLFEPGWTGGLAFPDYNIVIIGISPDQIDWGKRTEAHELTHVLVGHLTFSCLGVVPTWLNEGLAVYGEGGPDKSSQQQFQIALADDKLLPVRSLSGGFSEDPAKADLSYSESYSLVNFLVTQYGQDKMLAMLRNLRDGATVDEALQSNYGFNIEGFEDVWRAAIGAKPRSTSNAAPTVTPTPTIVPTIVPISGAPIGPTISPTRERPTPSPIPTLSPTTATAAVTGASTPTSISIETIILIGLGLLLLLGILLIVIARRSQRRAN